VIAVASDSRAMSRFSSSRPFTAAVGIRPPPARDRASHPAGIRPAAMCASDRGLEAIATFPLQPPCEFDDQDRVLGREPASAA
jgi:hypothetical protein